MENLKNFAKRLVPGMFGGLIVVLLLGTSWTYDYDVSTPPDTGESPRLGAQRIREFKNALQERLNVYHVFGKTGNDVNDPNTGMHRSPLLLYNSSGQDPNISYIDVGGILELQYRDSNDTAKILTSDGKLNIASDEAVLLTGNQTIAGEKTFSEAATFSAGALFSDVTTLADGSVMASDAAPVNDVDIVNKKYVTDIIAAYVTLSTFTLNDSESNAMVRSHAYKAQTSGVVFGYCDEIDGADLVRCYVGSTDDPVGTGTKIKEIESAASDQSKSFEFLLAKDEYFEITHSGSKTVTIFWRSFGTLAAPIDQD